MKAAMALVVVLGGVAAVAAAVLVGGWAPQGRQVATTRPTETEASVLVAARDLPALSVIGQDAVTVKMVARAAAPKGALSDPVQAVGKILIVPVIAGEAMKEADFAREGSGVTLAVALPPGKRAVSVLLNDYSGMVGLLYPGCVVDLMVSFQPQALDGRVESTTRTLLRGVQVLAIGQRTVDEAPPPPSPQNGTAAPAQRGDQRMVTLLVSPSEAQSLQLAMQRGTISLALRNPLDRQPVDTQATRLADLTGTGRPSAPEFASAAGTLIKNVDGWRKSWASRLAAPTTLPARDEKAAPPSLWEVLILRGQSSEVKTFPMPRNMTTGFADPSGPNRELEARRK